MNATVKWIVVNTCRLLVGATFVFSGIVKLIDPHGTEYRLIDYAVALSLDALTAHPLPIVAAIVLAVTEFCLGIYLIFGIRRRLTTRLIMALMLVFTPLTLWLAMTDAVADCGCFGDALHLTNWQTFAKNAVLMAMAVVLLYTRRWQTRLISEAAQWLISLYSILYSIGVALFSLWAEPIIDFRPFYVGQDIAQAMQWPDDPEQVPEILDFTIEPVAGLDTTDAVPPAIDEILADTGYTFLLIAPYLNRANDAQMDKINDIADFARANNHRFLCLTASPATVVRRWRELTGAEYDFAFADELTLKTIVRSNPGLLVLRGSRIVDKRSDAMLEGFLEPQATPFHQRYDNIVPHDEAQSQSITALCLAYILPPLLLTVVDRIVAAVRWWWRRRRASRR
ncbi:MAG: DoxX family protein [Bacteroidaceae bacterium]|nr:DoxX family protein [Bacteroidaceae bacterium]